MRRHPPHARAAIGIAASLSCVLAATLAAGTVSSAGAASDDRGLDRAMPVAQALSRLDDSQLARVARLNDMSVSHLVSESVDDSLWVGPDGRLFYVDDFGYGDTDEVRTPGKAPYPLTKTFKLHSLASSTKTIYLDFTGHRVTDTAWNDYTASDPDNYPAYSIDGNNGAFSKAEKTQVQLTFQRVAEDYAPFNVDVTTEAPPESAIDRSGAGDQTYGTRLLITRGGPVYTDVCNSACGGVAFIDVFDLAGSGANAHREYQPGFVFTLGVGTSAKNIAEAASHEVGHNFSLEHDGTSAVGYYQGHGAWAPIMGVGYYEPVSQWSKGEYADANNTSQDDIALIKSHGAPGRNDDHGNNTGSATVVPNSGNAKGLVGTAADKDVFRFQSAGGSYTLSATPAPMGPNLDIQMRILRSNGTVLATINPDVEQVNASKATGLNATTTRSLPSGRYYLEVSGTGFGDPATTGYSKYGSLGIYSVRIRN